MKQIKMLLLASMVMLFTACGGGSGSGGEVDDVNTATSSILDDATFYTGPRPTANIVTYTNESGDSVAILAYPGQVHLVVTPGTAEAIVQDLIEQNDGTILSKIPVLGQYLVEVNEGSEDTFMTQVRQSTLTRYVSANAVYGPREVSVVDLSDLGKTPEELVVALISSPVPNDGVVIAQLEDFLEEEDSLGNPPHYISVEAERESITGDKEYLHIHVGGLPGEGLNQYLRSSTSTDQIVRGLAAAIAGAEINGQKLVMNLSYGVETATSDTNKYYGNNAWAEKKMEKEMRDILNVLRASDYVQNGNVILDYALGNGKKLWAKDANGDPVHDSDGERLCEAIEGLDLKNPINKLQADPNYSLLFDNVFHMWGALDRTNQGVIADYSNYGPGVMYSVPTVGDGTSFVSPQAQGATYNAWQAYPNLTAEQISNAIRNSADWTNGMPVLDEVGILAYLANLIGDTYTLATSTTGNGRGTISSSPSGTTFASDTVVTLTAIPASNSTFTGWSGACSGNGACVITMDANTSVIAEFTHILPAGAWSGYFKYTASGDGGCTYYNEGPLYMTISLNGDSFSGSSSVIGIELPKLSDCGVYGFTSSHGSVSGTFSDNNLSGSFTFPIVETGVTMALSWTATFSGNNTISGTFDDGGGSFTLIHNK